MVSSFPNPITSYNFSECWQYADKVRRTARLQSRIWKSAGFFSSFTLLLLAVFSVHGLIFSYMSGVYCDFLRKILHFVQVWQCVSDRFLQPDKPWYVNGVILLALCYGAAFAVFLAVALVTLLLYHPFKKKFPADKPHKDQAAELTAVAKQAYFAAFNIRAAVSMGILVVLYLGVTVLISLLGVFLNDASLFQELLTRYMTNDYGLNCILFAGVCCVLYALFDYLRSLMTCIFVWYPVSYDFVMEAESYYVFTGTQQDALPAAEVREKALELERFGAYGKAKELLLEAAHRGDVPAMEHYARHCLIARDKLPARFWLERCAASGEASETAKKYLKRMKWHRKIDVNFLK